MWMEGMCCWGDECSDRPYPFGSIDTGKGINFDADGDFKRQTSDKIIQELPRLEKAALLGESFFGERLFCEYHWLGWGDD